MLGTCLPGLGYFSLSGGDQLTHLGWPLSRIVNTDTDEKVPNLLCGLSTHDLDRLHPSVASTRPLCPGCAEMLALAEAAGT